jgi:hypothetical protein
MKPGHQIGPAAGPFEVEPWNQRIDSASIRIIKPYTQSETRFPNKIRGVGA